MGKYMARSFTWLLLAPALLSLVYINGLLYPFIAPKTLLFRGLGIIALAAFAYLALSGHEFYWSRLRNKLAWLPAALLFVAYATSLIGIDFYHSFWSVYDRGDGLLTLTIAVLFFYSVLLSADRKFLWQLFKLVAWVATAVSAYVLVQWLSEISGINFTLVAEARGRLGGTLGNAAFLAGYLGMAVWATLAIAGESRGSWRKVYYVGAALQFVAIVLAATRGTLLALFVVGFLTLLYLAWKGEQRTRTSARVGLAGLLLFAGLFFSFREQLRHAPFEPVRRIASISLSDATVSSRLFIWQHVFGEAMKRPLTGYGAEHIAGIFDRVYDPGAILEQWFDRSHNAFLDYFVQFGILGTLLYTGLIASLGYVGATLFRRKEPLGVFLLLLSGTYAIQNFFVFDTAVTLWFLLAALAAALAYESAQDPANKETPSVMRMQAPRLLSYGVAGVIVVLLYPIVIQPLRANLLLADGYTYHVTDVDRAISDFQRGLSLNTYADIEYGYQAYTMYTDNQQTMLAGAQRVAAYRYALQTLTSNYERYPYDARTAVYLAHVLDSAPPEEAVDEATLRAVLARATLLSPKRAQPWYLLSNIALRKGDQAKSAAEREQYYREAFVPLEEYAAKVPGLAEPRFIIASLYFVVGDKVSAKKWADEGLPLYRGGTDVARKALRYYIAAEDWPNVRRFLTDIVTDNPMDYPVLYDLAKAEFLTGNRDRAVEIVQELRLKSPGLVETDPVFLKSLGA
ncbi:O-antigen ligase family protein [Candidatus Kaiserbacteria bacterium]|nr:O-antigen ligase family protein [Candidatus Kaiserbacteria bacterium]